jgi:hypothetical protein
MTALVRCPLAWDPATGSFTSGEIERHVLQPGDTATFGKATFPIAVRWLETTSTTPPSDSTGADDGIEPCCVVCGPQVLCGCAVVTPCGNCCTGSCSCQDGVVKRFDEQ